MIDKLSLFLTAATTVLSTGAIAVQVSTWIVRELHIVGVNVQRIETSVGNLERTVDSLDARLKTLEEAHR